jgi:CheY-like chemotaxis protein/DNA-binding XRE family transcriptional regulator
MALSQITLRFGAAVRQLRHGLGLSQEALAERADLHRTYIADIERGARNVTLKSIEKLAQALQVSAPTLLVDIGPEGPRPDAGGGESGALKQVEILLVEDSRDDVELTLRAFKQARITNPVQVVPDGKEALDYLFCTGRFAYRDPEESPRLVLLDLNLPKVSGIEVLRRLKADKRTADIPVVILTTSRSFENMEECQRLGAETYIVKPADFQGFAAAVHELGMFWLLLDQPVGA